MGLARKPGVRHARVAVAMALVLMSGGGALLAASPAHASGVAPVAADDVYNTSEATQLSVGAPGVLANDSDDEGDPLAASLVSDVATGALDLGADGSFTYTPTANFNGTVSFTYVANDGTSDSAAATVTIAVASVNDPPSVSSRTLAVQENAAIDFTLDGNDPDDDASTLTFAVDTNVAHGSLSCSTAGSCQYAPVANYSGPDSFTYHAEDPHGAASASATVTLNVSHVNTAPTATSQAVTATEDTPKAITLGAVDGDGDPLTYTIDAAPLHGTLTAGLIAGAYTYTPDADYDGSDSF